MERIYRVRQDGETFYAVERDGELRRACRRSVRGADQPARAGARRPRRRSTRARAGAAVEDRLRRPELQGSRRRSRQAAAGRAAVFIKPSTGGDRAGRADPAAAGRRPRRSRGRARRRDRPARASRVARRTRWDYVLGLTCVNDVTARDLQNEGVAVHARQGLRHLRADRAVHRRPGSNGEPRDGRRLGQRRAPAGVDARAADLSDRSPGRVHHVRDDAASRATSSRPARRRASARWRPATRSRSRSKASAS